MALPTLIKTYEFDVNNRIFPSNETLLHQETMLKIKQMLTGYPTLPWTVIGSSDASAASMDGTDRWLVPTDLTWNIGTRSWIVLENTLGVQLCIDLNISSSSPQQATIFGSLTGVFSGGSISARPTAVDEFQCNTSPTINYWMGGDNTGSADKVIQGLHANDGTVDRIFIFNVGQCVSEWSFEQIQNPRTGHAIPYSMSVRGFSSWTELMNTGYLDQGGWNSYEGGAFGMYLTGEGRKGSWMSDLPEAAMAEEIDGEYFFSEMGFFGETNGFRGPKGKRPDIWFGQDGATNSGDNYPANGTKLFVGIAATIIPWDGVSVMETA